MPRRLLSKLLVLAILPAAAGIGGCAKSSAPPDASNSENASSDADVLLDVSRTENDATPLARPSLPDAFQGPPLKPRTPGIPPIQGETIAAPAAVPEPAGSSTPSDMEAGPRELLESDPPTSGYLPPTLEIDPARLFRPRSEWSEAETAADALGRIGAPATDEVLAMLDDPSPHVRRRGAEILARIGNNAEAAIEPLIRTLEQDPDPQVRKAAAYALGQMGPKAAAAAPALMRMLRTSDSPSP